MNPTVATSPPATESETRAEIESLLVQTRQLSEETRALHAQIDESQRNTLERIEAIRQILTR